MSPINKIPDDVLLVIFQYHVWINFDTPQRLLRISQRWNSITTNAASLFGDLLLCDTPYFPPDLISDGTMKSKIFCNSALALMHAIKRTKGSKFELTVMLRSDEFTEEAWVDLSPSWFQRCRALRFVSGNVEWMTKRIKELPVLERLEIEKTAKFTFQNFGPLLNTVSRTSPRLYYLQIPAPLPISPPGSPLVKVPASITYLQIASSNFWTVNTPAIEAALPNLKTLVLELVPLDLFPPKIYANLVNLTLRTFQRPTTQSFDTPCLKVLTIFGSWNVITQIQAPILQSLSLLGEYRNGTVSELFETTLRPKKLAMDLTIPEVDFRRLLREVWRDVEDLHLTYIGHDDSLWRPLTQDLMRSSGLCPNLCRLVMLSPKRSTVRQAISEALLQSIVSSRKCDGLLVCAKYGWYERRNAVQDPRDSRTRWVDMII